MTTTDHILIASAKKPKTFDAEGAHQSAVDSRHFVLTNHIQPHVLPWLCPSIAVSSLTGTRATDVPQRWDERPRTHTGWAHSIDFQQLNEWFDC